MKALLPVFLLLPACNWVSQADVDERLPQLDDDGDGFTRDGGGDPSLVDCDDTNRDIYPGAVETWYDGVDSDCLGDDDFDQDGDGFASAAETTDGTDCDDLEASTNPEAVETWYDGVDSDCLGDDDFDQDGDGFASAAETTDGTDCDDLEASTNPEAVETWYDGVDSDCLGDDDFDQDGDGFASAAETTDGTDCDDLEASTNPEAVETWYDGVDSDCLGDDDFDQDGDGFASAAETTDGTDCDDLEASAYPGALEDLSESLIDHDCDGSATSVGLSWDKALSWTGVGSVRLGETSDRFYISVVAEDFTDSDGVTYYDLGIAAHWDNTSISGEADGVVFWSEKLTVETSNRQTLTGHDMIFGESSLYGVMGTLEGTSRTIKLFRSDTAGNNDVVSIGDSLVTDIENMTLWQDDNGHYRFVTCDTQITNGRLVYGLTNEVRLDDLLDSSGFLYQASASGMGDPAGCVAQMTAPHQASLWFANEGAGGLPQEYSFDTSSGTSSSLSFSTGSTYPGFSELQFADMDFVFDDAQGDAWFAGTLYLDSKVGVYRDPGFSGSISEEASITLQGSDAPQSVSLSHSALTDTALAAWTSGSEHGLLWWSNGTTGSAALSLDFEPSGIEVLLLDDGIHAVVVAHNSETVEMALFQLF